MNRGFTLIELMFGVALTSILALGISSVATKTIQFYKAEELRQSASDSAHRWVRYFKNRTERSPSLQFTTDCYLKGKRGKKSPDCMTILNPNGQRLLNLQNKCRKVNQSKFKPSEIAGFFKAKWDLCLKTCPAGEMPYFVIGDPKRKTSFTFPTNTKHHLGASLCFDYYGSKKTKARVVVALVTEIQDNLQKATSEILLGGVQSSTEIDWVD